MRWHVVQRGYLSGGIHAEQRAAGVVAGADVQTAVELGHAVDAGVECVPGPKAAVEAEIEGVAIGGSRRAERKRGGDKRQRQQQYESSSHRDLYRAPICRMSRHLEHLLVGRAKALRSPNPLIMVSTTTAASFIAPSIRGSPLKDPSQGQAIGLVAGRMIG